MGKHCLFPMTDISAFLREHDGDLETSITTYKKGSSIVTILACDHTAETGYFQTLKEKADSHDYVLYEPFEKDDTHPMKSEADAFSLVFQPYAIDYGNLPSHWINGEDSITMESGDSVIQQAIETALQKILPLITAMQTQAMQGGTKTDNIQMKLTLLFDEPFKNFNYFIGQSMEPRQRSVISKFEGLNHENTSVALLYGAGHAVFFERYLLENDYEVLSKEWLKSVSP